MNLTANINVAQPISVSKIESAQDMSAGLDPVRVVTIETEPEIPPVVEYVPAVSTPVWLGETFVFKRYARVSGGEPDWYKWYLDIGSGYELIAETQDVEVEITPDGGANVFFLKLACGNEYGKSESLDNQIAHLTSGLPVTAPLADFVAWPQSAEIGEIVFFAQTETNHLETSYRWFANDEPIGVGEGCLYAFTEAGTYTIKLIATNSAGEATETKTNYIGVASPTNEGEHLPRFFMPSLVPGEGLGLYLYNDSAETVTIAGVYFDPAGNVFGNPLGTPVVLPPGLGTIIEITAPDNSATLYLWVSDGSPAAADLTAEIGINPSDTAWLWAPMLRPRIVLDGAGRVRRARSGIVDSEPFDSAWVVMNCTGFTGQTPREIACTYSITITGTQTVIKSGAFAVPANGIYGFITSEMGLGVNGWFDLKIDATCKEHELALVRFFYFDEMHTHSVDEFLLRDAS